MNFSLIIPVYNEEKNIISLLKEINYHLNEYKNFEIIIVDDFSSDNSCKLIQNFDETIKIIYNKKNMGQSFSIYNGIKNSRYENIITIDADGQNNPKDINIMIKLYQQHTLDLISGIRSIRRDTFLKKLSSKYANFVRRIILKDNCLDTGCSLKIFKKKIFLNIPYFNGIHRFIPSFFECLDLKVKYVDVDHRSRIHGKSNYGIFNRLFNGIYNLFLVKKLIKKIKKK